VAEPRASPRGADGSAKRKPIGWTTCLACFRSCAREIVQLPESHGFLRGLTSVVGFKTVLLPFSRDARAAGDGKYNRLAVPVVAFLKAYNLYRFAQGVATMCILMLFLGGIQLMAMGLLGAYVGRTYDEAKRRPKFIVDEALGFARSAVMSLDEARPEIPRDAGHGA
jgi:polyisoprenyl-phosphate glycosyltransferase